jgi:aminoglycoside 6'-N-acetyltransferase I
VSGLNWRIEAPNGEGLAEWRRMRHALWPEMSETENFQETKTLGEGPKAFVRLALDGQDRAAGFVEATLRTDYVNGCETSPVVFLEGIYVEPWARRQGVARRLVEVVQQWARQMNCSEMASDALLANADSHGMHLGLGFEETERVVYFRKLLTR